LKTLIAVNNTTMTKLVQSRGPIILNLGEERYCSDALNLGHNGDKQGFALNMCQNIEERPTWEQLQVNLKLAANGSKRVMWAKNNLRGIATERTLKVIRRLKKKQANRKK